MKPAKLISILIIGVITTIYLTSCSEENKEPIKDETPATNKTINVSTDASETESSSKEIKKVTNSNENIEVSSVDESKYDDIKEEDVRLAKISIDYFEVGDFESAEKFMREALEYAIKDEAPKLYIDNLKTKLSTILINLERYEEGRALLKEVHGVDTLK